jgi:hypothetical protein
MGASNPDCSVTQLGDALNRRGTGLMRSRDR